MATATFSPAVNTAPYYSVQLRKFGVVAIVTLLALTITIAYLLPFGNMLLVAVSSYDELHSANKDSPVLPLEPQFYTYAPGGQSCRTATPNSAISDQCPLYHVPQSDGSIKTWALVNAHRTNSDFIDPANPSAGLINWKGNHFNLDAVTVLAPHPENFTNAWNALNFPLVFGNTLAIAVLGMIGTLLSSICVAYAFARFPIPGKNILFIILIATIILPTQVTLIPTYAFFSSIHWTGTWLPLIIPHFFANAYNVFLLRQFFLTLPKQLDEAAMIDGASPFQVLTRVIIPQAWPAIIAVGLFHFIFAWNDFFNPLIYLLNAPDKQPIAVAVQQFNSLYSSHPESVQATSVMAMVVPLVIFFLAQKVFMRGVVITGVEK